MIFVIQINNEHIYLYADDICIIIKGKNENEISQNSQDIMRKLENWIEENLLEININKTKYMIIKNKSKKIELDKFKIIYKKEEDMRTKYFTVGTRPQARLPFVNVTF